MSNEKFDKLIKDAILVVVEMQLKKKVITEEEYVSLLRKLERILKSHETRNN